MLNLQRVLGDNRLLRALTGLNFKAFNELKAAFIEALSEAEVPRRSNQSRQRAKGAGRKPRLETVEEKLIYILVYFKCYPTFQCKECGRQSAILILKYRVLIAYK